MKEYVDVERCHSFVVTVGAEVLLAAVEAPEFGAALLGLVLVAETVVAESSLLDRVDLLLDGDFAGASVVLHGLAVGARLLLAWWFEEKSLLDIPSSRLELSSGPWLDDVLLVPFFVAIAILASLVDDR